MDEPRDAIRIIVEPVVLPAAPFDPEGGTVDLARPGGPEPAWSSDPLMPDPLVPGPGLRGQLTSLGFVFRRCGLQLVPAAVLAALPAHFFVGRVDDTVVAAPALSDLAGVFGLLLLPLMGLAFFAVSALPQVILLAATVGLAVPAAAGTRASNYRARRLVADRVWVLWLWLAAFGVLVQALPLLIGADRLGPAVAVPLAVALGLTSVAGLTVTGLLGCVVLVERGGGLGRVLQLMARGSTVMLAAASLGVVLLPRLGEALAGPTGSTVALVVAVLVWSGAGIVTYAGACFAEDPAVTSRRLLSRMTASEVA